MSSGKIVQFARRAVVAIGGPEAEAFLNNLVTADMPKTADAARYGTLLTPQGKILFDFIVFRDGERFLFDLPEVLAADFVKRITFYRLRAKVEIATLPDARVFAGWDGAAPPATLSTPDPRLAAMGWRAVTLEGGEPTANATEAQYDAHRIALGVPEGGIDFPFGDTFPHDAAAEQLAGVDFRKGCYVGQEVVSRMQHRGTARRRFVVVQGDNLPEAGAPLTADGKPLGNLGSSANGQALAIVRLDRTKEALDAATPILAGKTPVTVSLPAWATYGWPGAGNSGEG